jgi:hypothetical protein
MNQQDLQQPFFARFLESQRTQEQNNTEQNIDPWPIPFPTSPLKDALTDKWPSDWEDV